jgi:parallel beta-helix repeat protein
VEAGSCKRHSEGPLERVPEVYHRIMLIVKDLRSKYWDDSAVDCLRLHVVFVFMKFSLLTRYCLVFCSTVIIAGAAGRQPDGAPARQTAGDEVVEPNWGQRLTVSVGPVDADIVGSTDKVIQAAVDYVARLGGGTVLIKKGTYRLRNSVYLQSRIRLVGEGVETILLKVPSTTAKLAEDSDWYDQEITLQESAGFEIGDGVFLTAKDAETGHIARLKRTLVARTGPRFKLDRPLRDNLWRMNHATVSTLYPLLSGEFLELVSIENLVLDGNRAFNEHLDGNYGGCIFLQDCNRVTIRNVTARNNNGDGISWQICHDILVENCIVEKNAGSGFHAGSGSQRSVMRSNSLRGNDVGIAFCWGIKGGWATENKIEGNRIGVSIGHRNNHNIISGNVVRANQAHGLLFREERKPDFAASHNSVQSNVFIDNGSTKFAVIEVMKGTRDVLLFGNRIVQNVVVEGIVGIRVNAETQNIVVEGNHFEGVASEVETMPNQAQTGAAANPQGG